MHRFVFFPHVAGIINKISEVGCVYVLGAIFKNSAVQFKILPCSSSNHYFVVDLANNK